nr:type II secretion system secretin GspD [Rhodoferax aquaticus]
MGANAIFSPSAHAQTASAAVKRGEPVTLNFNNADIESVARTMAAITGRNVVVDPRVKGNITLTTDSPASPARAFNLFVSTLRLQGFTVVNSEGIDKVVPEADAKLQSTAVGAIDGGAPATAGGATNQLATQIIRLQYENANNLVAILRPLISPNNTINVNPGNNALVITDYADNLRRLARIIAALDVPNATDLEVVPLKNTSASDIAPLLQRLLDNAGGPAGGADSGAKTTVLAETRTNALILRAPNQARLNLARSLIERLDKTLPENANGAAGNIYVVYLKNANATQLATTLRAALSGDARAAGSAASAGSSAAAGGSVTGGAPTTGGQIQADTSTNSLVITATEPQYRQIRAVIDKLDARRAQVYVESLIAEVSSEKAAEFGIQWQGASGNKGDSAIGLLGTNFGSGGKNILNLASAAAGSLAPAQGLNIGVATQTNGVYVLGLLARFIESTGSGNVLSTPNLLTLDNEEAKIVIGKSVPFVTGQFTNTGGGNGSSVNPFQTIERKDVGLTLKVKPQISENGTVRMSIYQEVSNIDSATVSSANGPTTSKRTIESNVLVDDGAVVVLGGLLSDDYAGGQDRVPGLADIPLFGNLFKSESRSRKKTNLMVFLRPVVIRDAAASDRLALDRYELMRANQQAAQPEPSRVLPVNDSVVLPPLSRPTPATPTAPAGVPAPLAQ